MPRPVGEETVAAVIVTHNRPRLLSECLDGLAEQSRCVDLVIVVNNGALDNLGDPPPPELAIRWVPMHGNKGSAGGFAKGLSLAADLGFDWAWTFQDDDRPKPAALADLLSTAKGNRHRRVGAVGCWVEHGDGSIRRRGFVWSGRRMPAFTESGHYSQELVVDGSGFDGTLIRLDAVRECGTVREAYFQVQAEAEFFLRISQAGWRTLVRPTPDVVALSLGEVGTHYWRDYYEPRNTLATVLGRGDLREFLYWTLGEARWMGRTILHADRRFFRVTLRFRGLRDGLLGRMGKRIDPEDPTYS